MRVRSWRPTASWSCWYSCPSTRAHAAYISCWGSPRRPKPDLVDLGHHPMCTGLLGAGPVRRGVDEDGPQRRIGFFIPMQQQEAGLGGHRHADLVGHREASDAFEAFLREKDVHAPPQFAPVAVGEPEIER